jgi:hypothetical protein
MALQPFVGPWPLLQFRNRFHTNGRTPWTGDQPVARPLPIHRTTHTQPSIPRVGFEPTIPMFGRGKKVHAFDLAATVAGAVTCMGRNFVVNLSTLEAAPQLSG